MSVGGPRFEKSAGTAQLVREAERRIGSLPGIEAVAATCSLPLEPSFDLPINIAGRRTNGRSYNGDVQWAMFRPVTLPFSKFLCFVEGHLRTRMTHKPPMRSLSTRPWPESLAQRRRRRGPDHHWERHRTDI